MKKRIIIGVYIVLCLVASKLTFSYIYNELLISDYEDGDYSGNTDVLQICNIPESYIAYYNQGNLNYMNGLYKEAVEEYDKALECSLSEEDECSVRINKALAMIKMLPKEYDNDDNRENSIKTLESARNVLTEKSCATDSGDGHSETAEELKKQIDDILKKLKEDRKEDPNSGDDNGGGEEKPTDPIENDNKKEQDIIEKLKQETGQGMKERKENTDWQKYLDEDYDFTWGGYVW